MLTRYTAWLLICAVLTANCSRLFVYAGFKLNQYCIATKLCENWDKPWMHCNGKCYFMKKMRQGEENEHNKATRDNLPRIEIIFFEEPAIYDRTRNIGEVIEPTLPQIPDNQYHGCFHPQIFQPPRIS